MTFGRTDEIDANWSRRRVSTEKGVEAEGFEPPVSGFRRRRPLRAGPHLDSPGGRDRTCFLPGFSGTLYQLSFTRSHAGGGSRTHNVRIKSPLLCHLSYTSQPDPGAGLEPAPSTFKAWRSPAELPRKQVPYPQFPVLSHLSRLRTGN